MIQPTGSACAKADAGRFLGYSSVHGGTLVSPGGVGLPTGRDVEDFDARGARIDPPEAIQMTRIWASVRSAVRKYGVAVY